MVSSPIADAPAGAGRARLEFWVRAALVLVALTLGVFVYLGLRPGGSLPARVYQTAPFAIAPLAMIVGVLGVFRAVRRPPLLSPGRLLGFFAVAIVMVTITYPHPYPSSYASAPSSVAFRLPFTGEWTVRWGGRERWHNALAVLPDRCFGYHFVRTNDQGLTGVETPEGSLAARQQVFAPAAGEVVGRFSYGEAGRGGETGEHLVLRVAPGTYLYIGPLAADTIVVPVGASVVAEQFLGHVDPAGSTFLTPEPHIAVHLQDSPDPYRGEGIPMRFRAYRAGSTSVDVGEPRGGVGPDGTHTGQRVQAVGELPELAPGAMSED